MSLSVSARERKKLDKLLLNLARPDMKRGYGDVFLEILFKLVNTNRSDAQEPSIAHVSMPETWTYHFMLNFKACDMCEKPHHRHRDSKMLCCSKCKIVHYCSPECQKLHWEQHKLKCSEMSQNKEMSETISDILRFKKSLGTLLCASLCFTVDDVEESFIQDLKALHPRALYEGGLKKKSLFRKCLQENKLNGDTFVFYASDDVNGLENSLCVAVLTRKEVLRAAEGSFHAIMRDMKLCVKQKTTEQKILNLKMYANMFSATVHEMSSEYPPNSIYVGFVLKNGPVVWVMMDLA